MVDVLVCRLPLLGEDNIVLLNGVLDDVGCGQHLLLILLSIDQPPVLAVLGSVLVPLLRAFSGTSLRTCFVPQDAVLDPPPPAYYFRISSLSLVLQ